MLNGGLAVTGFVDGQIEDGVQTMVSEGYDGIDDEVQYGSFSLYDWHYARNFNDDYEVITWNVGGKGYLSSIAADLAMKIFNDTDTRYGYDDAVLCHANWHDCDSIAA